MLRGDLLNLLVEQLDARRYLEIGVLDGETFGRIRCPERVGVDPSGAAATVRATSDDYFAALSPTTGFDLVFVDGDHVAAQVVRDVENALRHLEPGGAIVVHDCNPPTRGYTVRHNCGTVFRGWIELRRRHPGLVVDVDLGCGVVLPGTVEPAFRSRPEGSPDLSWEAFEASRVDALGLVSEAEFRQIVTRMPKIDWSF